MPRYIDADTLLKDITNRYCENCDRRKGIKNGVMKMIYEIGEAPCKACGIGDMRDELDDAPTVDTVEVVYCKDCVYSYPFDEEKLKDPLRVGEWRCVHWGSEMHEDDYCSCGKRRKNDLR